MPILDDNSPTTGLQHSLLHPASMDAADAHGIIIDGRPGPAYFNYQVQLSVTPRGTWIACWTQGGYESDPTQQVVASRSVDGGATWSPEIVVEPPGENYRVPAWIVSFCVPHTGRIYLFYWFNFNGVPLRDAGDIFFRYSDDDGLTWSDRRPIGIPRTALDRDEPGEIHGWNFGQPRLLPTGQVLMTYTKIKRSSLYPAGWSLGSNNKWQPVPGEEPPKKPPTEQGGDTNQWCTEVFFLELANILTETDPERLSFRFLPEGDEGVWVPFPGTEQNVGMEQHFGQEGTVVGLSGERLLCVLRSRQGHPYYAISADRGATWTKPAVLRLCPGGPAFNQPCAPCPIAKLADGRFVFLFHNTVPGPGGWYPRHPLWITIGREAPGVSENAGLYFNQPKVIVYNDCIPDGPFKDFEIGYPQFYRIAGRDYVAYANKTCQLRINEIPASLMGDTGLPIA